MLDAPPADLFAALAVQDTASDHGDPLPPVPCSDRPLTSGTHQPEAAFDFPSPVDSLPGLHPHLEALRNHYAPFLETHAPACDSRRSSVALSTWDWKIDRPGEDWTSVTLPHYGEPVGPATTLYRLQTDLPELHFPDAQAWLCFDAVDYRCALFVNGHLAGTHEGFFAPFAFPVSRFLQPGTNTFLLQVENDFTCLGDDQGEYGDCYEGPKIYAATNQGFDDPDFGWHHCPPGMGIPGRVRLEWRPPVFLDEPFVRPLANLKQVELRIPVSHHQSRDLGIRLEVSVHGHNYSSTLMPPQQLFDPLCRRSRDPESGLMDAAPGENEYRFLLDLPGARPWHPDHPWLLETQIRLYDEDGTLLDQRSQPFGLRCFERREDLDPKGILTLNGKPLRLRGANTMGFEQRRVMNNDLDGLLEDLLLAKAGHLNFLRFTQRPVQREVYELCDRLGLLFQTDLPLFAHLTRGCFAEAVRQAGDMERHIRNHPAAALVSFINEPFPAGWRNIEHRRYRREDMKRFLRAASEAVGIENPDRVIKAADGDYQGLDCDFPDHHCYTYWYHGHGLDAGLLHKGFAFPGDPERGYGCGEFGAEALDTLDLMRKHAPADWLPVSAEDADWTPDRISKAQCLKMLPHFVPRPATAGEWGNRSRAHQATALRRMIGAFRRDPRNISCAVHLFIDAWPCGWMKAVVDVDRMPKPGYYAMRDGFTPLALSLRLDRTHYTGGETVQAECWICNDLPDAQDDLSVDIQLMRDNVCLHAETLCASAPACRPEGLGRIQLRLPETDSRKKILLQARLRNGDQVLHATEELLHLHPKPEPFAITGSGKRAGETAHRLAEELGTPNLWICSDAEAFLRDPGPWLQAASEGRSVLLTDFPDGTWEVDGTPLHLRPAAMTPRYFVDPVPDHPLLEGFQATDFSWVYDPECDRPAPLASQIIEPAPGWQPLLRVWDHGWSVSETPEVWTCALRPHGSGRLVISTLHAAGRLQTHPPLRNLFQRLFFDGRSGGTD